MGAPCWEWEGGGIVSHGLVNAGGLIDEIEVM